MNNDNVTPFRPLQTSQESVSLQEVMGTVQQWRSQKKRRSEKIPDLIWEQIFILIKTMPRTRVLSALGISGEQLRTKELERSEKSTVIALNEAQNNHDEPIEFCESKSEYPLAYKPAKAFDTTTSVVELYRPDGMLMKIHICTDSFEELLRAFFKG